MAEDSVIVEEFTGDELDRLMLVERATKHLITKLEEILSGYVDGDTILSKQVRTYCLQTEEFVNNIHPMILNYIGKWLEDRGFKQVVPATPPVTTRKLA